MSSRESFWTEDPKLLLRVEPGFELVKAATDTHPGFDGD